jgi:hypothetical protein
MQFLRDFDMFELKKLAIQIFQQYSHIGHLMSDSCEIIKCYGSSAGEKRNAIMAVGKLMADIQFYILYPIIKEFPELTPEYLLDKNRSNVRYNILCWESDGVAKVLAGMIDAACVRAEFNKLADERADYGISLWMEIVKEEAE